MTVQITLSDTHTATTEKARSSFKADMPVIVVFENGRRTPGQWYADTIAASTADEIYLDFGAGWKLNRNETALLKGFAMGVVAASRPVHTVGGEPIGPAGIAYGTRHDMDCPACQGTPYTASPRSETYWAS